MPLRIRQRIPLRDYAAWGRSVGGLDGLRTADLDGLRTTQSSTISAHDTTTSKAVYKAPVYVVGRYMTGV